MKKTANRKRKPSKLRQKVAALIMRRKSYIKLYTSMCSEIYQLEKDMETAVQSWFDEHWPGIAVEHYGGLRCGWMSPDKWKPEYFITSIDGCEQNKRGKWMKLSLEIEAYKKCAPPISPGAMASMIAELRELLGISVEVVQFDLPDASTAPTQDDMEGGED